MQTLDYSELLKERLKNNFKGAPKLLDIKCPDCQCPIAIYDEERIEVDCIFCGCLLMFPPPMSHSRPAVGWLLRPPQGEVALPQYDYNTHLNKSGKRIKKLMYHYQEHYKESGKKYRRNQHHLFVGVVSTWLTLSQEQQEQAHYMLDRIPDMRKVTLMDNDYRKIVACICIMVKERYYPFYDFKNEGLVEIEYCKELHLKLKDRVEHHLKKRRATPTASQLWAIA